MAPPTPSADDSANGHHGRHRAEDRSDFDAGNDTDSAIAPVDQLLRAHGFSTSHGGPSER
jgi:hypothetical protein